MNNWSGIVALLAVVLLALPAGASNFRERLIEAERLVQAGEITQAVEAYQDLQIDYPEEPAVLFGLGAAQYRRAEVLVEEEKVPEAAAAFQEARTTFDRVLEGAPTRFSAHAAFNRANCVARLASATPESEYQQAIAAYRAAASAFEAVLQEYPGYEAAQRNLDHVRYQLKLLQQNPPEQEEQDEQQQEQPPEDQPQRIGVFLDAKTDIERAEARVTGDNQVLELLLDEKDE